jgi:uncharacterized protein YajQ (UPF0234 family)
MDINTQLNDFIKLHLDLVNLKINKKKCRECLNKNCKTEATYNYKNFKEINIRKFIYCSKHKLENMIDIKSKKCINCNIKQPVFNYDGEKNAIYCGDCKLHNTIDIKSKKCIGCNIKQPIFNYENEKSTLYCNDCKLENMIDIKSKKCITCNIKRPNFNYENNKNALYCTDCKLTNMIDVTHKKCKTFNCDIRPNKKFKGYCLRCFIHNFPDSKIIRDYGTREAKVTEFIKKEFKELNITYNKQIQGGCSQNRPDIFIDCLTHSVIIEVDENQHKWNSKSYTPECEIQRVNNLFTDLADRPIVFIRFNPDAYTNSKNKLIKSCFEYTEDKGLPKANKSLQPRLKKLKEEIEKNINMIPNVNITTIKLFYDGY